MGHFVDELVIAWNIKGCLPSGCKDIGKNSIRVKNSDTVR